MLKAYHSREEAQSLQPEGNAGPVISSVAVSFKIATSFNSISEIDADDMILKTDPPPSTHLSNSELISDLLKLLSFD